MPFQHPYDYIPQWTPINAPIKMPPKVAADAAAKPAKAKADKTATTKADKAASTKAEDFLNHPETKLMWAVLCDLSKDGKMSGFNWEEVKEQIEASTAHAAR